MITYICTYYNGAGDVCTLTIEARDSESAHYRCYDLSGFYPTRVIRKEP